MDGEGSFAPLDSSHRFEDIIFRAASALAAHCLENTGGEVGVSKGRVGGEDFSRLGQQEMDTRMTMRISPREGNDLPRVEKWRKFRCNNERKNRVSYR